MLDKIDVSGILHTLHQEGVIDNHVIATNMKSGSTDGLVYLLSDHGEDKYVLNKLL